MVGWSGLVPRRAQASRAVVLGRAGSVYAARGGREARSGLSHVHGRHQRPSACLQKRNGRIQAQFGSILIFINDFWWDLKLNTSSFELRKTLVYT